MTRKPDDWMPLRIGEYLADTTHLTRDQHGAYLLLIMAYWRRGGALPADDGQLAAMARATGAEWRKMRPIIAAFFREDDGLWFQKRCEEELEKARATMAAKSEAGKTGAREKWGEVGSSPTTRSQRLAAARQIATHTALEWAILVELFSSSCVRCGVVVDSPIKDHIKPIYQGGSDGIDNLQPLCKPCNSAKGPECVDHRNTVVQNWRELLADRLSKCLTNAWQTPAPIPSTVTKELPSLRSGNARGTRWPSDAVVPEDWIEAAGMKRAELGLPPIDLRYEAERFRNYWASKSGAQATKVNWRMTWMNWATDKTKTGNGKQNQRSAHDKFLAGGASFIRDLEAELIAGQAIEGKIDQC